MTRFLFSLLRFVHSSTFLDTFLLVDVSVRGAIVLIFQESLKSNFHVFLPVQKFIYVLVTPRGKHCLCIVQMAIYTTKKYTYVHIYRRRTYTRRYVSMHVYVCRLHSYDGSPVNSPAALVLRSYHSLTHAHHTFNSRHNAHTHTARRPQLLVALP